MEVEGPVAKSEDDYVRLAVELSRNADARRRMRARIRERCEGLFQDASVIDEYNDFFWKVTRAQIT
jgi:predicted O-linked N-acetylglucosamine transferase (SPINDLY family)